MLRMGAETGKRRAPGRRVAPRAGSNRLPHGLAILVVALLAGGAWVYLVGAAIAFGTVARSEHGAAWLFTLGATVGAVVCLVLVFSLVARALTTLGLVTDYKPRRAAGRRRAR
jgi:hypothetical protein